MFQRIALGLAALFLAAAPVAAMVSYKSYPPKTELYQGLGQFSICKGRVALMPSCVVDGDTLRVDYRSYRIDMIDTPETKQPKCERERELGMEAKALVIDMLNRATVVTVTTYVHPLSKEETRDKYGRLLAKVEADGVDIAEALIKRGLAKRYIGGTKSSWCD